ncbi:MAG: cysteine desulfurase family protein [Bifidobacterium sp.]|uniref:cysteine desulfurase family protein n=2 Tax=Bifidobacterium sp. TaxID=41200 RepID=UPI0039E81898
MAGNASREASDAHDSYAADEAMYLDAASTVAVSPSVIKAMLPFWLSDYANPSSVHAYGKSAAESLENARRIFASDLGASAHEVIFTSGGTESDNLAIKGMAMALRSAQISDGDTATPRGDRTRRNHIAISAIEHPAIMESAQWMSRYFGFHIDALPVDSSGRVDVEAYETIVSHRTALVSVALANNEVGTMQPISELARIAHINGALMHTDAVQAVGHVPIDMASLGADAMSVSGHKFGTPKGIGALILRSAAPYEPLISGGGQESGRRSGTQDVAGAVGMAVALHESVQRMRSVGERIAESRDMLISAVLEAIPEALLTGAREPSQRLPGHASFVFPRVLGEALLVDLDTAGIMCSSGSACSDARDVAPRTLMAMGYDEQTAKTSIRMTFQTPLEPGQIRRIVHVLDSSYHRLAG